MWNNQPSIPIFLLTIIMIAAFINVNDLFIKYGKLESRVHKLELQVNNC